MKTRGIYFQGIAIVLFLMIIGLIVFSINFWFHQPVIGFDFDYKTGVIYQVYVSSPNSHTIELSDTILAINGQSMGDSLPRDILQKENNIFLVQKSTGEKQLLFLNTHAVNGLGLLEHFIFSMMALGCVVLGVIIVFKRDADATSATFFIFMWFTAIILIFGDISRVVGGPIDVLFRCSMIAAAWTLIDFHWHMLDVRLSNALIKVIRIIYAGSLLFEVLLGLNVFTLPLFRNFVELLVIYMLTFFFILFLFIFQAIDNHLSHGMLRILMMSYSAGFAPVIFYVYVPLVLSLQREVPAIVATLPLLIIPVSYFLLLQESKRWTEYIGSIISFVFSMIVIFELYRFLWFPISNAVPDSMNGSNSWFSFVAVSVAFFIILVVYKLILKMVRGIIFGDVEHKTRTLQRMTREGLKSQDVESVLGKAGSVFQELFNFDVLTICLRDGKVIRFSLGQEPVFSTYSSSEIYSLIQKIDRENLETGLWHEISISPMSETLLSVAQAHPQLFDTAPRYCFLLRGQMNPVGMICGSERHNETFGPIEIQQLNLLLDQYQIIVENILLLEESQKSGAQVRKMGQQLLAAREGERQRIARDMHDNIIQSVTAFHFEINNLYDNDQLLISDEKADDLQQNLHAISAEIRDICFNLRPPALDAIGLQSAIVSLVDSYHGQDSFKIDFQISGADVINQLSDQVSICLYRVLQESLRNVARHAKASEVNVVLAGSDSVVSLVVNDDGVGFKVPDTINSLVTEEHFGLVGLQEFLEIVNGDLQLYSVQGKGSHVMATIPIQVKAGKDGLFFDCC